MLDFTLSPELEDLVARVRGYVEEDALPAEAREQADESIVGTLAAIARVEAAGDPEAAEAAAGLVQPAREAFVDAMHVTAVGTAAAGAIANAVLTTFPAVTSVRVTVHKPHAPVAATFSDVGVTIVRTRQSQDRSNA